MSCQTSPLNGTRPEQTAISFRKFEAADSHPDGTPRDLIASVGPSRMVFAFDGPNGSGACK